MLHHICSLCGCLPDSLHPVLCRELLSRLQEQPQGHSGPLHAVWWGPHPHGQVSLTPPPPPFFLSSSPSGTLRSSSPPWTSESDPLLSPPPLPSGTLKSSSCSLMGASPPWQVSLTPPSFSPPPPPSGTLRSSSTPWTSESDPLLSPPPPPLRDTQVLFMQSDGGLTPMASESDPPSFSPPPQGHSGTLFMANAVFMGASPPWTSESDPPSFSPPPPSGTPRFSSWLMQSDGGLTHHGHVSLTPLFPPPPFLRDTQVLFMQSDGGLTPMDKWVWPPFFLPPPPPPPPVPQGHSGPLHAVWWGPHTHGQVNLTPLSEELIMYG